MSRPLILNIGQDQFGVQIAPISPDLEANWNSGFKKTIIDFLKSPLCSSENLVLASIPGGCEFHVRLKRKTIIKEEFSDILNIPLDESQRASKLLSFAGKETDHLIQSKSDFLHSQMLALAASHIPIVVTLPEDHRVYQVPQDQQKRVIASSSIKSVADLIDAIECLNIPPPPVPSPADLVTQPDTTSVAFSTVDISPEEVNYRRNLLPHLAFLLAMPEGSLSSDIPDTLLSKRSFSSYHQASSEGYTLHRFENTANAALGADLCMAGQSLGSPTVTLIRPQLSYSGKSNSLAEPDHLNCIDLMTEGASELRRILGLATHDYLSPQIRYFPYMAGEFKIGKHTKPELKKDQRKAALVVLQAQKEWFQSYGKLGHDHSWPCRFAFVLTASYDDKPGTLRFYSPTKRADTPVSLYYHTLPQALVPSTPAELGRLIHLLSTPVIECLGRGKMASKIHYAGKSLPLPNASHLIYPNTLSSSCHKRGMALLSVEGLDEQWVSKPYARHGEGLSKRWITEAHLDAMKILNEENVFPDFHWHSEYGTLLTRYHLQVTPTVKHASQLLEVVRRVHNRGYLHGDLHEGNVLFHAEGVKLIDLDFTRSIRERVVPPMNLQVGEKFFPRVQRLMPPGWRDGVPMCEVTQEFEKWCGIQIAYKITGKPLTRFEPEITHENWFEQAKQRVEISRPITPTHIFNRSPTTSPPKEDQSRVSAQ